MENKFFNIDELMIEYGEMTSFDFASNNYLRTCNVDKTPQYAHQPYTFKYGQYDVLDMLAAMQ